MGVKDDEDDVVLGIDVHGIPDNPVMATLGGRTHVVPKMERMSTAALQEYQSRME